MNKKQWMAQYIHDNLPTWQRDNHLSAAQVAWFQQRYPLQATVPWRHYFFVLLAIVFIGVGVTLMIAANWQSQSRLTRLLIAFLPLALSQALLVFAIVRQKSRLWRESAALTVFFSIGIAMALVGQIYQLSSSLTLFFLGWLTTILPLAYLARSTALQFAALGLMLFAVPWDIHVNYVWNDTPWLWRPEIFMPGSLLLLFMPWLVSHYQQGQSYEQQNATWRYFICFWLMLFLLRVCLFVGFKFFGILAFASAVYWLCATLETPRRIATVLLAVLLWSLLIETPSSQYNVMNWGTAYWLVYALILLGLAWFWHGKKLLPLLPLPLCLAFLGVCFTYSNHALEIFSAQVLDWLPFVAIVLFSIQWIQRAIEQSSRLLLNGTLLWLAAAVILRMLIQEDFSLWLKGGILIGVGVLFIVVNRRLNRQSTATAA